VLVPVKSPGIGKSRLRGFSAADRVRLATAFAVDTVTACVATPAVERVVVVTEDADFAGVAEGLGAVTCGDGPVPGLNAALRHAAALAHARWPALLPVALLADLPALLPADLTAALEEVAQRPAAAASYAVDAEGTGTTLYTAAYDGFSPSFGPGSAAAHAAAGAADLTGDLPSLRRDVDDLASLRAALALGVGRATSTEVRGLTWPAPA
jgi:2-phospho-L-lactate guanylyltransferase